MDNFITCSVIENKVGDLIFRYAALINNEWVMQEDKALAYLMSEFNANKLAFNYARGVNSNIEYYAAEMIDGTAIPTE